MIAGTIRRHVRNRKCRSAGVPLFAPLRAAVAEFACVAMIGVRCDGKTTLFLIHSVE
jgi:hypothetical protein